MKPKDRRPVRQATQAGSGEAGPPDDRGEVLLYQTEDGRTKIEARLGRSTGEVPTVWLSLAQLAQLFQRDKSVISRHIKGIFETGELDPAATVAVSATVQLEQKRRVARNLEFFSLEMVLAVGYRVRSHRGIQFRKWATERLREYVLKGFTLDDERLKEAGGGVYFDELLARIRDVRSSEKVFWKKVLEIYATSIDYDPSAEASKRFFATVQNKMHWAIHGQTAAEVVASRADAGKPHMGLTSWSGSRPRASDAAIAKNYLTADELDGLNRVVTAYLEFAELQAMRRKAMYMADWIAKLDDFLRLSDSEVLSHAGSVSHEDALARATREYERFQETLKHLPSAVESAFEDAIKRLPAPAGKPRKPKRT